ncbi:MAG: hypothetical protein Ct9H300mP28_04130 [Pseudomonadota bacterium]|nr:MAG: hypothetical protein Ct9H300mP28_04130 [Pseudomonadota bacterium]
MFWRCRRSARLRDPRKLGISKIFIHRFSGILSAYGMGLADIVVEKQQPSARFYLKGDGYYSEKIAEKTG